MALSESWGGYDANATPHLSHAEYDWSNLCMRTKFLRETAAEVDQTARGDLGPVTAKAMYWRLHALAGIAEATMRDLGECAMVTAEQRKRVEQARAKFSEAEDLLRECYEAEPSGTATDNGTNREQ